jgi:hypothetical protein
MGRVLRHIATVQLRRLRASCLAACPRLTLERGFIGFPSRPLGSGGQAPTKSISGAVASPRLPLRFGRGPLGAYPAHRHRAIGITIQRRRYCRIPGPTRRFPKFANGFCRHTRYGVCIDPHPIWQAAKCKMKRSEVFRLISHEDLPSLCQRYRDARDCCSIIGNDRNNRNTPPSRRQTKQRAIWRRSIGKLQVAIPASSRSVA